MSTKQSNGGRAHGPIETVINFKLKPGDGRQPAAFSYYPDDPEKPVIFVFDDGTTEAAYATTNREAQRIDGGTKPKVVNSIAGVATLKPIEYVFSNHKVVFVIDTGTIHIGNDRVSVASYIQFVKGKDGLHIDYFDQHYILFKNCLEKLEEQFAWKKLILPIISHRENINTKFAIITDSDRGGHSEYNARKLPIYMDFKLPKNFELIYSADQSSDSVLNIALRNCHNSSKGMLKDLKASGKISVNGEDILIDDMPSVCDAEVSSL